VLQLQTGGGLVGPAGGEKVAQEVVPEGEGGFALFAVLDELTDGDQVLDGGPGSDLGERGRGSNLARFRRHGQCFAAEVPGLITELAPFVDVLVADGLAVELCGKNGLDFGESI